MQIIFTRIRQVSYLRSTKKNLKMLKETVTKQMEGVVDECELFLIELEQDSAS